jgi:hypothetical protein
MTVYVDDARIPYGNMIMCHMLGDDEEELHLLASAIGVKRKWFHRGHYNICKAKRAEAVRLGARQVSAREIVALRAKLELA